MKQIVLETCEFCLKEKSATYSQLGVGILGAAMCPRCKKVTENTRFKTELAHMLVTGEGDLDKFFKRDQVLIPICNTCGIDLKSSNWNKSDEERSRFICKSCKTASTLKNRALKTLSGDNSNIMFRHECIQTPALVAKHENEVMT